MHMHMQSMLFLRQSYCDLNRGLKSVSNRQGNTPCFGTKIKDDKPSAKGKHGHVCLLGQLGAAPTLSQARSSPMLSESKTMRKKQTQHEYER